MIYATFDNGGVCTGVTETNVPLNLNDLPVVAQEVAEKHSRYALVDGVVVELAAPTPSPDTATWEQIRDKRNDIELMPITLDDGRVFDYDKDAMDRFDRAIASFDNLPTLVDGELGWKLYDNSVEMFSKDALIAVRDELQQKQAIRAAIIFVRAEQLVGESRTLEEIQNLTLWGL